jgi:ferritin
METTQKFKLDMAHLQKVQRTLRKAGNIFPNEKPLIDTLEDLIIKAQDDTSLNTYYSMAQYLKQRVKELKTHLDQPVEEIEEAQLDLEWSINYLQWLVKEQPKET